MSEARYIIDATPENFAELVIGNSMRGPVMVNFWSAKAGPCIKLWPLLEKLESLLREENVLFRGKPAGSGRAPRRNGWRNRRTSADGPQTPSGPTSAAVTRFN